MVVLGLKCHVIVGDVAMEDVTHAVFIDMISQCSSKCSVSGQIMNPVHDGKLKNYTLYFKSNISVKQSMSLYVIH